MSAARTRPVGPMLHSEPAPAADGSGWQHRQYPAPDGGIDHVFAPRPQDPTLTVAATARNLFREIQTATNLEDAQQLATEAAKIMQEAFDARLDFLHPRRTVKAGARW